MSTLVRTIVCAYSLSALPVSWMQVCRRCERAVARAKLAVRVRLYPLEDLPDSFEVLIVPPELRDAAVAVARGARVLTATRDGALETVAELIRELESGETLRAERAVPGAPKVAVHRGGEEL